MRSSGQRNAVCSEHVYGQELFVDASYYTWYCRVNVLIGKQPREVNLLFDLQTAYTIPILAFAFVCHPEVLPIYTELNK